MPVFRWGNAFEAIHDLEREMDRWLRSVNFTMEGVRAGRAYPPVNVYELDDEFLLTAEIPGAREEDLELSVSGGVVTLRGSRGADASVSDDRFRRSERSRGVWERILSLPARVREEDLHAELKDGVLKLHLPKAPSLQPRQIRVNDRSLSESAAPSDEVSPQ